MHSRLLRYAVLACALLAIVVVFSNAITPAATAAGKAPDRYIVVTKNSADYAGLRSDLVKGGASVAIDMPQINTLVVYGSARFSQIQVEQDARVKKVAKDHIESLVRPAMQKDLWGTSAGTVKAALPKAVAAPAAFQADPAFSLAGLMWDFGRIEAPRTWDLTAGTGISSTLVGVADTGLDYTHPELANQVIHVENLVDQDEGAFPICSTFLGGPTDAQLAAQFHGPEDTDWNGHGSWIGGNIAAEVNQKGINGIAPSVKLVSLKISGNCGSAWDSTILHSFLYAADHGIDVVSISFGGYLDRSNPYQNLIWQQYVDVVKYAQTKGTVIVAAAGNEHVRLAKTGQVISHGPLTTPAGPNTSFSDLYGLWETPAGVPGVVAVSSTGNVVVPPSSDCTPDNAGNANATCKPNTDKHQSFGINKQNQLSYFSNYGPRIDVAAPGGARKFNLPFWDRGGTPGFPVTTDDGYNAYETFSITSNWATEITCYDVSSTPGFTNDCYSTIQGTSMATPHASATLALIISATPGNRHTSTVLVKLLKAGAMKISGNQTPVLSPTDTSKADLTGAKCPTGYCHLGGLIISDKEAYGAGLVDPYIPISANQP